MMLDRRIGATTVFSFTIFVASAKRRSRGSAASRRPCLGRTSPGTDNFRRARGRAPRAPTASGFSAAHIASGRIRRQAGFAAVLLEPLDVEDLGFLARHLNHHRSRIFGPGQHRNDDPRGDPERRDRKDDVTAACRASANTGGKSNSSSSRRRRARPHRRGAQARRRRLEPPATIAVADSRSRVVEPYKTGTNWPTIGNMLPKSLKNRRAALSPTMTMSFP